MSPPNGAAARAVSLRINQQQRQILDLTTRKLGLADLDALVGRAVREFAAAHLGDVMSVPADWKPAGPPAARRASNGKPDTPKRELLLETVIEPSTGKALELRRGQVLRVTQLVGGQFADFNAFNLHDYKEHFSTGRTRHMHGPHPTAGDFLWSRPPRDRAIMAIVADSAGANDIDYERCSAFLYEYHFGVAEHTNCQDIQAEAQREYGLTPDDVHEPFNIFTRSGMDADGTPWLSAANSREGDHVELLALIDVLAVTNVCGADVFPTGTLESQPLKLEVFQADEAELARVEDVPEIGSFLTQRTPDQFKLSELKATRPLERDPGYVADFFNTPLRSEEIPVRLSEQEAGAFDAAVGSGRFGPNEDRVLRQIVFGWWGEAFMEGGNHSELAH
jgi:uncharacterized protein YcgI (DUF1989 family)